ncbi:MAG: cbb3-type cytochrome c oxidase N-terminal domain-containing protein [Ferruginibacter sp.]
MRFLKSVKYRTVLTLLAVFTAFAVMAQTTPAASAPQPVQSGYNQLATLLVVMIVVLAFVIWGMGRVLTALGRQLVDKDKMSKAAMSIIMLLGLSLLSQVSFAQDAANTAVKEVPNYGGLSANTYYFFLTVLGMEVFVILFLAFSIRRMYTELLPEVNKAVKAKSPLAGWWSGLDKKIFTRAVPVEKEADVMLDHDYDGIRELDNALPPWWKYGFYVTIGVAFIYLLNFHVLGNGLNPTQEYNAEVEKAKIAKEAYEATNKDRIDENNVPMANAEGIKAGQALFEANCIACHLKDGGGNVGPNLTDDYWIHKGSLNDIYHTIKNGYADKGMQSWANTFTEKEISYLASFVKSLKGTKPATPKAPQGDFWTDEKPATDSAKIMKPDSLKVAAKPDTAAATKK